MQADKILRHCFFLALALIAGCTDRSPTAIQHPSAIPSNVELPGVPLAPSGVSAALETGRAVLRWTDESVQETSFEIDRRDEVAGVWGAWEAFNTVPANSRLYSDGTIWGGSGDKYQYRIRACNGAGCSGNVESGPVVMPLRAPEKPTDLNGVAISSSGIELTWTDASHREANFEISRRLLVGGVWTEWESAGSAPMDGTAASMTGLDGGATYQFRIRACNTAGCSAYMNSPSITTPSDGTLPPATPSNPVTSPTSTTTLDLSWTDGSDNEINFQVRRRLRNADGTWQPWISFAPLTANATGLSETGLSPGTTYQYTIRACNEVGCSTWVSSGQVTMPAPPPAPSSLVATPVSSERIDLTWDDADATETRFELERRRFTSALGWSEWGSLPNLPANTTIFSDTGLSAGSTHQYRIRACNDAACSAYTTSSAVTTTPPPANPTNLIARVASATRIELRWTDQSSDETFFKFQRRIRSLDGTWGGYVSIANLPPNTSAYTDSSLTPGTGYQYRIRACRLEHCSNWVASAQVTTPVPPTAPTLFSATAISSTRVDLSWNDTSSNEEFFALARQQLVGSVWSGWTSIGGPAANTTTFSDTTAVSGATYRYRIRACMPANCSAFAFSNEATTP